MLKKTYVLVEFVLSVGGRVFEVFGLTDRRESRNDARYGPSFCCVNALSFCCMCVNHVNIHSMAESVELLGLH